MSLTSAAPARPDGDARKIRSYTRRGTRLTAGQQLAWDAHNSRWVIPEQVQTAPGFRLSHLFDRPAPLVVEIGFGSGEPLAQLATQRPELNVVGFEVWRPGVAACVGELAASGATNVWLSTLDATWCFEHIIEPVTITELWTFFPDPWPKTRHHKRRLVNAQFARLAASRLVPGGVWRLATDWSEYGEQIQTVLDAEPTLCGGLAQRYAARPFTRFERKGIRAGRPVLDFTYTRSTDPVSIGSV